MERVFRYSTKYRNTAWKCLAGFVGFAALSVPGALDAPADRRWIAFIVFEGFWLFWIAMAVWMVAAYYKTSLHLKHDEIVLQGVRRTRVMECDDKTNLRWRMWPAGGSFVLKTSDNRIALDLNNFDVDDRVQLIRQLRSAIPESQQQGWQQFCERHAAPLLDKSMDRPPNKDEVLVDRKRIDRLFVIVVGISTLIAVVAGWILNDWKILITPLSVVGIWLLMRLTFSKQGYIDKKLSSDPKMVRFLVLSGILIIVVIVANVWIEKKVAAFNHKMIAMGVVFGFAFGCIMVSAAFADREKKLQREMRTPASLKQWDEAVQNDESAPV